MPGNRRLPIQKRAGLASERGNDFFGGSRMTDDGVKAAATDVMYALTGLRGRYDPIVHQYLPPEPFRTWGDVVSSKGVSLKFVADELQR